MNCYKICKGGFCYLAKVFVLNLLFLISFMTNAPAQDWLSGWRDVTVAIGVIREANVIDQLTGEIKKDTSGKEIKVNYFKVIGTGVICANPNEKDPTPYLLTAKHVFDDPKKNWHRSFFASLTSSRLHSYF